MTSPLSALLERSVNPAIGAYESLRLVQDSDNRLILKKINLIDTWVKYELIVGSNFEIVFSEN
jgi:hypothetical protein